MTDLSQATVALAVLACAVIYGTDIFAAIVLRPALAMLDSETIMNTMGRVHEIADRRMPVPGIVGLFAAVVGTVTAAIAGRWDPAVARCHRRRISRGLARYLHSDQCPDKSSVRCRHPCWPGVP